MFAKSPNRFRTTAVAAAVAALVFTFDAHAADKQSTSVERARTGQSSATAKSLSLQERQFATKAAEAGMEEVELGKVAERKAQNAQVKEFGARMVQDHSKANDRLKQVVSTKGFNLPTRLDKSAQKALDELTKLSGGQFDEQYIKKQVSDHKKVISEFEKEAKSANDGDLRAFASDTLPTLREHLDFAESAQKAVQGEGDKNASSQSKGLKAAKKATGASAASAERQERMPVAKTGM
jgi:putative membrane protein